MYSGIAHIVEMYDLFHVTTDLEVLTLFVHNCYILTHFRHVYIFSESDC